jgi:hypothetical protein
MAVRNVLAKLRKRGGRWRLALLDNFTRLYECERSKRLLYMEFFEHVVALQGKVLTDKEARQYNNSAEAVLSAFRSIPEREQIVNWATENLTDPLWVVCKKCAKLKSKDKALGSFCDAHCRKGMYNTRDWLKRKAKVNDSVCPASESVSRRQKGA